MVPGFAESMMGTSTTWEIDWSGLRPFFLGRLCRSLRRIYSSCSWCCYMLLPGVTVLRYVVWYVCVCVTCVLSFEAIFTWDPLSMCVFLIKDDAKKHMEIWSKPQYKTLCHLYLQHMSLRGSRYQYYLWEVEVPLEASPSKDSVFLLLMYVVFFLCMCFCFECSPPRPCFVVFPMSVHVQKEMPFETNCRVPVVKDGLIILFIIFL